MPNGIVTISRKQIRPATAYARARIRPPKINQITLRRSLISQWFPRSPELRFRYQVRYKRNHDAKTPPNSVLQDGAVVGGLVGRSAVEGTNAGVGWQEEPEAGASWDSDWRTAPAARGQPRPAGIPPRTLDPRPEMTARTVDYSEPSGRYAADPVQAEMTWQNYLAEEDAPEVGEPGGRRLFTLVFAFSLITSIALWWFDTPGGSLTSVGAVLTAGGRITGMVGGYLLLAQVLLMSRAGWLERWIGAHNLMTWHRELGGALLVLVVSHVVLILLGYAHEQRVSVAHETWAVLTTYEDMISALIATAILVASALLAIRAVRRLMPYETWYYLHVGTYLILLLGYGHQFATGEELMGGFGRWFWAGLYVFVAGCLVWGRVIAPIRLNARHRFRVAEVTHEGAGMISLYIAGKRLDELRVRAGQ